jgi:hypothetical protein
LVGRASGALLRIDNSGGGPALNLRVEAGAPPLTVSPGAGTATNLRADSAVHADTAGNADTLDGLDSSQFMPARVVKSENAQPSTGQDLVGDGTRVLDHSCPGTGSRLLSGGPANIDKGTILLESFPWTERIWRVRIQNDASLDSFSVVVLCASAV